MNDPPTDPALDTSRGVLIRMRGPESIFTWTRVPGTDLEICCSPQDRPGDFWVRRFKPETGFELPRTMNFICTACKEGAHGKCLGKMDCDCQHRPAKGATAQRS